MTGNYLLDTSILVRLLRGDTSINPRLTAAASTTMPSIALGEIHLGALKSVNPQRSLAEVEALAARLPIIPVDAETARAMGV